ncbi:hypothetical protein, partial [Amycolatopsis sp. NPDC006125]|uniref:hypothetical protein n=1 Tax=Amycolatopsis sp. NPDC006125 TaxID=3156730 RepID=UPI0033B33EAD
MAIERMNTPGSVACSVIRIRSPSSAPPENGDDAAAFEDAAVAFVEDFPCGVGQFVPGDAADLR